MNLPQKLEAKWKHINAPLKNEDEVADGGSDLVKLNMVKSHLRSEAVKAFGEWVQIFDTSTP